jgi:hypothetical protein
VAAALFTLPAAAAHAARIGSISAIGCSEKPRSVFLLLALLRPRSMSTVWSLSGEKRTTVRRVKIDLDDPFLPLDTRIYSERGIAEPTDGVNRRAHPSEAPVHFLPRMAVRPFARGRSNSRNFGKPAGEVLGALTIH